MRAAGKSPRFNIETKLSPERPGETPDPETFARLVIEAVRAAKAASRTTIQSFDWRTLRIAQRLAPEVETVCLTSAAMLRDKVDAEGRRPSPWLAGLDLLWITGEHDRAYPPAYESELLAAMRALGLSVDSVVLSAGHGLLDVAKEPLKAWWAARAGFLPGGAGPR